MRRAFIQRLVDSLPSEVAPSTYKTDGKTIRVARGDKIDSVGGEGYRRALVEERRALYRKGKLPTKSIAGLSKDNWGAMGFLATNGKTGASGDFTTLCPQMYFNKGCFYCYRRASLTSGVNNKLTGENVWYTGEILQLNNEDIDNLNKNGGLRIQSFGDWMSKYSTQLADLLIDAETVGLQIKIITKETSMIDTVALLKEQGLGKNLYFNLSADYTIEKQGVINNWDTEGALPRNPLRPYIKIDGDTYWKRASTVEEANQYRIKYPWVNTRIVATTIGEFIEGLRSPIVDVVTGYHGKIRQFERVSSATGETLLQVEPVGDVGMPRFSFNEQTKKWTLAYEGKTATHKALAKAIEDAGLQFQYYIKSCCITGRCATCEGKCGKIAKDFNIKNATNADKQSVAYWQKEMTSAADNPLLLDQMEDEQAKALLDAELDRSNGVKYSLSTSQQKGEAVKYSKSSRQVLDEYVEKYGAIEPGETPSREVSVPKQTSDDNRVSKTVRTVLEAGVTPDEALPSIEKMVAKDEFSYEVYSDNEAIADAETAIHKVGWARALNDWIDRMKKGNISKANTAMGWALYNNAVNSKDTDTALTILDYMVRSQRSAAQALQATRILKQLSPQTRLYQIARSIADLQRELNERYGSAAVKITIDPDLAQMYLDARTEEQRAKVTQEIYKDVGRQLPSRFVDKWNAWRYLAMLGNPRTHIRNIVGNAGFAPIVAAKNLTATAIESAVARVSRNGIERTKSFVGLGKAGRALLSAAWADYSNIENAALGVSKYTELQSMNKAVREGQKIFRIEALNKANKANSYLLDKEDVWFSRPHYAAALAQYCKAHGITAEQIKSGKVLNKARAYAIKEAQKATYRDLNAFSQFVSGLGRNRSSDTNGIIKLANIIVEGILPFRKTPANILARGVEYSPLGLAYGIKEALVDVQKGNKTAAEAIDTISAGLTGTGLMALGVLIASMGRVRGHGSKEDEENKFMKLMGHQAYALELPNGTSVTLDWLAPEALPFFIGVNLWEQTGAEENPATLSDILTAMSTVTEPLLEMSCLQSLNNIFESLGYANKGEKFQTGIATAATNYLTQLFPTLLGQIERTGEDKRYEVFTQKQNWLTKNMQYTLSKISAKIPGWDYQQIPYINAWGETEVNSSVIRTALKNFGSPAYFSKVDMNKVEEELLNLYQSTGEKGLFPQRAENVLQYSDDDKIKNVRYLSEDEYVTYATVKGQESLRLINELMVRNEYQRMSDEDKVETISRDYAIAKKAAALAIDPAAVKKGTYQYEALEAEKKYKIKIADYLIAMDRYTDAEPLVNAETGKTITNSKSLLIMEGIYEVLPFLTDAQYQALWGYFNVGKKVKDYNKAQVKEKLAEMRAKAKK